MNFFKLLQYKTISLGLDESTHSYFLRIMRWKSRHSTKQYYSDWMQLRSSPFTKQETFTKDTSFIHLFQIHCCSLFTRSTSSWIVSVRCTNQDTNDWFFWRILCRTAMIQRYNIVSRVIAHVSSRIQKHFCDSIFWPKSAINILSTWVLFSESTLLR